MPKQRLLAYCSHSSRVNGARLMRYVTRLWRPPWFLNTLFIIHDVAEPQIIRRMSLRAEAYPFQKCSMADTKLERGASIHGSSSMNTTFLPSPCWSSSCDSRKNASDQSTGTRHFFIPLLNSDWRNSFSWARVFWFANPECWNANLYPNVSLMRNVLPMRLLPVTATNSEYSELYALSSSCFSSFLPMIMSPKLYNEICRKGNAFLHNTK